MKETELDIVHLMIKSRKEHLCFLKHALQLLPPTLVVCWGSKLLHDLFLSFLRNQLCRKINEKKPTKQHSDFFTSLLLPEFDPVFVGRITNAMKIITAQKDYENLSKKYNHISFERSYLDFSLQCVQTQIPAGVT